MITSVFVEAVDALQQFVKLFRSTSSWQNTSLATTPKFARGAGHQIGVVTPGCGRRQLRTPPAELQRSSLDKVHCLGEDWCAGSQARCARRAHQPRSPQRDAPGVELDDELTMLIGLAPDGALLEVGVIDLDGDDPVVVHAMPLRQKFRRFLR